MPWKRYAIWIGTRKPIKHDCESLAECFTVVRDQASLDRADDKATRVRVFDREPYITSGVLHLIYDSKENQ